jgi:agmatine deiminase
MNQYSLPPEWAPQSAVMLTWPNAENAWRPSLEAVEQSFIAIAKAVVCEEDVLISCLSEDHVQHVKKSLEKANVQMHAVKLYAVLSHDVWARDHGPLTVTNAQHSKLLNFTFNGWGNKYPAERDNALTEGLHRLGAFNQHELQTIDLVLEGGSIEVDGQGTLLTTRSCLLSPARNPHLTEKQIESQLKDLFNVQRILWLDHGYLAGDDTDGHIDTLARFTDPQTIAYVTCDDPNDEHYDTFQKMEVELRNFKDYQGNAYRLVPLPWPKAKYSEEGERLPATYANFLIINNAVLMPTYDDTADKIALQQLEKCFPDRKIVPIPCRNIIEQYGSLHCVTMQLPHGVL